jgi:hypothetical protein
MLKETIVYPYKGLPWCCPKKSHLLKKFLESDDDLLSAECV